MKFAFKFSNLLGSVYKQGNLLFSPDGNTVISPVGNRITFFDLKSNKSETLPIEGSYNFTTLAMSPNGCLLVAVNEVGEASLCSLVSRTVLHEHHFKQPVHDLKFSPNGKYFAMTKENNVFLYRAPGPHSRDYNPFALERVFHASVDETTCIDWSSDSRVLAVGSKDMATRIYAIEKFENLSIYSLGSHTDSIVGCFFEDDSLNLYTVSKRTELCVWECSVDLGGLVPKTDKPQKPEELDDDDEDKSRENEHGEKEKPGQETNTENSQFYYKRLAKHFLKNAVKAPGHVHLTAAAFHRRSHILVTGFSTGAFLLHEMPDCNLIHSLSISDSSISAMAFNNTGDWISLGCSTMGQLIVWEWQSESFVMKQQGHFGSLQCLAYSPDGQFVATGSDDGKVKVWNTSTGFCFITFTEHKSGVTGVIFTQSGKAVVSSSLDGTVRAFDMMRYRNFRTFTSPRPTQFSCIAVDASGEVICAGSQECFEIFVWSMQNGRLLEVLAGHEAPVSGLSFSSSRAVLISTSWDKTIRIWDIFEHKGCWETVLLTSDGLAAEFRPDGQEFAVATLDGQLTFFSVHHGVQIGSIEGRNDLGVGRRDTDMITAKKLQQSQYFNTLCYSADGECILAAGRSKYVCIYHIREQILLKKFEITCNHSFDAIDDFISKRRMTEFGNMALVEEREEEKPAVVSLPGTRLGDMAARAFKPEVRVSCVCFSPTGRAWAAATTEGLLVYSLDNNLVFDPYQLETDVTPQAIRQALRLGEHARALVTALRLNERDLLEEAVESIPIGSVEVIARHLPQVYVEKCLDFLAVQLENTRHIEFYLTWIQALLVSHGPQLKNRAGAIMGTLRMLQKNLTRKYEDLSQICDHNKYTLQYILAVSRIKKTETEGEEMDIEAPV